MFKIPDRIESARLIYRKLQPSDNIHLFELDSNPNVHRFLGMKPVKTIGESDIMIADIMAQYAANGIGRMAVILKETGEFIGWSGLKIESNVNGYNDFPEIGYRFIERFWGNGYATEAARTFVDYGFNVLQLHNIYAYTDLENKASQKVLENAGLKFVEMFEYDGSPEAWYEASR